jgi:DUF1365 family protein
MNEPTAKALLAVGHIHHARLRPKKNSFIYRTYFLMLPMRALRRQACDALRRNRFGLVSFHDSDHGDGRADVLAWLEELLAAEGINDASGEIWLQCHPRVLGYVFKPVSFWYCHRQDGSLAAVVAEVNNTFGERHCYLLQGDELARGQEIRAAKVFHVSPFCAVAGHYRFRFTRTASRAAASVNHADDDGLLLRTSISGELQTLTARSVRSAFFGMPLMTAFIVIRIHWQALRLLVKRVPFFSKPEPPHQAVTR